MEKPLVDIVIPTYNRKKFLKQAVQSVQKQSYTNWYLFIVDDGSTDETSKSFYGNKIEFLKLEGNKGVSYSRNMGIKQGQAEWIAFLDSDDEWLPQKLEKQNQRMMELKGDGSAEDRISKIIKYCRSKYTAGRVDVLRSRPFKENLEDYKEKFLKRAFSNYSQPSQQAFGDYMNRTLKINFLSEENIDSTFTDGIKKAVSEFLKAPKITSLLQISQISPYSVMDLDSVCSYSVRSEFSPSSFYFKENAVYMSVFACTFHDVYGEQTLTHELEVVS